MLGHHHGHEGDDGDDHGGVGEHQRQGAAGAGLQLIPGEKPQQLVVVKAQQGVEQVREYKPVHNRLDKAHRRAEVAGQPVDILYPFIENDHGGKHQEGVNGNAGIVFVRAEFHVCPCSLLFIVGITLLA